MRTSFIKDLNRSNELKPTHQFYESVRATTMEFPQESRSLKNRNASLDSRSNCIRPVNPEFETYQKISQERIKLLEKQLREISEQLAKMQKINRKLLEEKLQIDPVEMHYMVQELIVADFKKELIESQAEVEKNRMEAEKAKRKAEQLILENKKLEGSIKRYRKIIGDMTGTPRFNALTESLSNSYQDNFPPQLPNIKNGLVDSYKPPGTGMSSKSFDKPLHRILPMLESSISEISSSETFHSLLSHLAKTCKSILSCERCTIFLISPIIQQLYTTFFSNFHSINRVLLGTSWILIHTDPSADSSSPVFAKSSELIPGIRTPEEIVEPIMIHKHPIIAVQCQNSSKGFDLQDSRVLKIVLLQVRSCLKQFLLKDKETKLQVQLQDMSAVIAALSKARSHQALANTIDAILPKFFEFHTAGIIFVDKSEKEFFSFAYSRLGAEKYSSDTVWFPATMGLSGETFKSRSMKVYENVKKKNLYNPEVDNIANASDVSSLIMSCLPGPNDTIVGILQLSNKISGSISAKDIKLVGELSIVIGNLIVGVNEIDEAKELTVKMKKYFDSSKMEELT
ncbi:unnamed protein product [Blepharisma stoltei]|uniref:GAF domain-containing protein n=1 Tax=Blepharisma stoltei TaxID=1481888 RepID=A0AAU9IQT7_9CILI|nr:unnamed protein product [Blepharisma stoltei]